MALDLHASDQQPAIWDQKMATTVSEPLKHDEWPPLPVRKQETPRRSWRLPPSIRRTAGTTAEKLSSAGDEQRPGEAAGGPVSLETPQKTEAETTGWPSIEGKEPIFAWPEEPAKKPQWPQLDDRSEVDTGWGEVAPTIAFESQWVAGAPPAWEAPIDYWEAGGGREEEKEESAMLYELSTIKTGLEAINKKVQALQNAVERMQLHISGKAGEKLEEPGSEPMLKHGWEEEDFGCRCTGRY